MNLTYRFEPKPSGGQWIVVEFRDNYGNIRCSWRPKMEDLIRQVLAIAVCEDEMVHEKYNGNAAGAEMWFRLVNEAIGIHRIVGVTAADITENWDRRIWDDLGQRYKLKTKAQMELFA